MDFIGAAGMRFKKVSIRDGTSTALASRPTGMRRPTPGLIKLERTIPMVTATPVVIM